MPPVRMISNRLLVLAAVREMATLVPPRTIIRVAPACAPDREEPYGTDTRSAVLCDPIGRRAELACIQRPSAQYQHSRADNHGARCVCCRAPHRISRPG